MRSAARMDGLIGCLGCVWLTDDGFGCRWIYSLDGEGWGVLRK